MTQHITEDNIKEVFSAFEVDKTGTLDIKDLRPALFLLKIDFTKNDLENTYQIYDNPNTLNEEEFTTYVTDRILSEGIDFKQRCRDSFNQFDEEGNGCLSREQIITILTQRGSDQLDEEQVNEFLAELVKNEDGRYQISELVDMLYDNPEGDVY